MTHFFAWVMILLSVAGCRPEAAKDAGPPPQRLEETTMTLGGKPFSLMIANDDAERQTGLMYRRQMGAQEGMIFVFPDESDRGFYMKNTPLPLDILFVRANGVVDSVGTMRPFDLQSTYSDGAAKYVIELHAGTMAKFGLKPGDRLTIPEAARDTKE